MTTIKTAVLKSMVNKASKGAVRNSLLPLTSLCEVAVDNTTIKLTTTDGNNYYYVSGVCDGTDAFTVTVDAEKFTKLITKMTCKEMTLSVIDEVLHVKGNGNYKVEVYIDESTGKSVEFPTPIKSFTKVNSKKVTPSMISKVESVCKPFLSKDTNQLYLTKYCCTDTMTMTTDAYLAGKIEESIVPTPILIDPTFMSILQTMDGEVTVWVSGKEILCESETVVAYGKQVSDIEDYPVNSIERLIGLENNMSCNVPKVEMVEALSRMEIFTTMDNNSINMNIGKDGIKLTCGHSGLEVIQPLEPITDDECAYVIDLGFITKAIKACPTDCISISYGSNRTVKIGDKEVSIIVALRQA